jgi:hypothetical protein
MLFSRFAKSAATLALLTIGCAAPIHAQNNKQIISGTWYEDRANTNTGPGLLILKFAETPTNKFMNVTNVACQVATNANQFIGAMFLQGGTTYGNDDLERIYSIKGNVSSDTDGVQKYYSIVQNGIFYKFGPGRFPSIEISTVATATGAVQTTAYCTIVGTLTDN